MECMEMHCNGYRTTHNYGSPTCDFLLYYTTDPEPEPQLASKADFPLHEHTYTMVAPAKWQIHVAAAPGEHGCEGCFTDRLTHGKPERPLAPFYYTTDQDHTTLVYCTRCLNEVIAACAQHPNPTN